MRFHKIIAVASVLAFSAAACQGGPGQGGKAMALEFSSRSFTFGGHIPQRFTCDAEDVSPELKWGEPPFPTKSFALIADDPDAPVGTWVHWALFNLPAETRGLPENVPKRESLESGALQGRNDFRKIGYGGPCPPPGKPHRYYFKLYALDTMLNLKAGASKADVERAMKDHILAQGEWMGLYGR